MVEVCESLIYWTWKRFRNIKREFVDIFIFLDIKFYPCCILIKITFSYISLIWVISRNTKLHLKHSLVCEVCHSHSIWIKLTKSLNEHSMFQGCLQVENDHCVLMCPPKTSFTYKSGAKRGHKHNHRYTFSKVFRDDVRQKEFFDETMLERVKNFIDGQNCLVFTYGVTNAGKTYTIQGKAMCLCYLRPYLHFLFFNSYILRCINPFVL